MKQIALYTDCLGAAHWSEPFEVIDEGLAGHIVRTADLVANGGVVTKLEIELWIEHMAPTSEEPLERQKASLSRWYAAMRENGLSQDDSKSVDSFLWGISSSIEPE